MFSKTSGGSLGDLQMGQVGSPHFRMLNIILTDYAVTFKKGQKLLLSLDVLLGAVIHCQGVVNLKRFNIIPI